MTQQVEPHDIEPRHIGFFERRWNMLKAFATKSFEHLFSIKTWVSSAVIFGAMALMSHPAAPEALQTIGGFFKVTPENWPLAMGKAIAIGTMLNAGIAMYKEAARCDECETLATQLERQRTRGETPTLARAPAIASPDIEVPQVPSQVAANKHHQPPAPNGWGIHG